MGNTNLKILNCPIIFPIILMLEGLDKYLTKECQFFDRYAGIKSPFFE